MIYSTKLLNLTLFIYYLFHYTQHAPPPYRLLLLPPAGCRGSRAVCQRDNSAPGFPWMRSAGVLLCGPQAWLQGAAHHHRGLLGALSHVGGSSLSHAHTQTHTEKINVTSATCNLHRSLCL